MLTDVEQVRLRLSRDTDAKKKSQFGQFLIFPGGEAFAFGAFPEPALVHDNSVESFVKSFESVIEGATVGAAENCFRACGHFSGHVSEVPFLKAGSLAWNKGWVQADIWGPCSRFREWSKGGRREVQWVVEEGSGELAGVRVS